MGVRCRRWLRLSILLFGGSSPPTCCFSATFFLRLLFASASQPHGTISMRWREAFFGGATPWWSLLFPLPLLAAEAASALAFFEACLAPTCSHIHRSHLGPCARDPWGSGGGRLPHFRSAAPTDTLNCLGHVATARINPFER